MGISTYQSYCGAQIFEAVGLVDDFVDRYFTGTATRIGGVGLAEIAQETVRRRKEAFGDAPLYRHALDVGGDYAFRIRGEAHSWSPQSVSLLQHAVRGNDEATYRAYAALLNETERPLTIRSLFRIKTAQEDAACRFPSRTSTAQSCGVSTGPWLWFDLARGSYNAAIAMNRSAVNRIKKKPEKGPPPNRSQWRSMRSAITGGFRVQPPPNISSTPT